MLFEATPLIDWASFNVTRQQLGGAFMRILSYMEDDGHKGVTLIENALRNRSAAAMVLPAERVKSEAFQFGADRLGLLAEAIEGQARACVETKQAPDNIIELVVLLRPMLEETLAEIQRESSPLAQRRAGFGRRGLA
jgi:histidine phosphotransfer protein HptB